MDWNRCKVNAQNLEMHIMEEGMLRYFTITFTALSRYHYGMASCYSHVSDLLGFLPSCISLYSLILRGFASSLLAALKLLDQM